MAIIKQLIKQIRYAGYWQYDDLPLPAKPSCIIMYNIPVNEKELLGSLPGFKLLTLEEMLNIQVISFEYSDHMALTTVTLLFRYGIIPLKFELSCSRQDGFCYEHVLYEEEYDEKEFPGFREAIDYIRLKAKTDGTAQMDK